MSSAPPRPVGFAAPPGAGERARLRAEAESLLRQAHRQVDPVARARHCVDAARVYAHALGEAVTASRALLAAVEANPAGADGPLAMLRGLADGSDVVETTANYVDALGRAGRWHEVASVLAGQAERAEDRDEQVGLFLAAAHALSGDPAAPARRKHLWSAAHHAAAPEVETSRREEVAGEAEAALAHGPGDAALAVATARLWTLLGRPEAALGVLASAVDALDRSSARAALALDAALLAADGATPPRDAVAWFAVALADDDALADAVAERLASLVGRWAHDAGVVAAAVEVFDARDDHWRAYDLLIHAADRAPVAEAPARRLAVAAYAERALGDVEAAFARYLDGLHRAEGDLAPFAEGVRRTAALGVPGGLDQARTVFESLGLWRPLAGLFEDAAGLARTDTERAAAFFAAGEVHENQLDDLDAAMRCYVEAHNHDRREPVYLSAGERVYRRRGEWRMVDRLLALQVKAARDPEVRRRLLEEQARVRQRHLGNPLAAYEALRAALAQGGVDGPAPATRRAFEALVEDQTAFAAIEAGLRTRADREGGEVRARLLLEIAALQGEVRQRPAEAAAPLMAAADATPEDEALLVEVVARLLDAPATLRIARWLAQAAERELTPETCRVAAEAAADRFERLDRPQEAAQAWRLALDLDPADLTRFEAARRAAAAAGPEALVALLRDAVAGVVGPSRVPTAIRREWSRALAVAADAAGDAAVAREARRWLVEDDPLDEITFEALLADLDAVGDAEGRLEAWIRRLAALAEAHRPIPPASRWAAARVAEEETAEPARAAAILRPLYVDNPHDPAVHDALDRLLAAADDRAGRLALWDDALALAEPGLRRRRAARALEALALEPPVAADLLVRARAELAGDDEPEALDALIAALRLTDPDHALAEALGRRYATDPGPHQAALLVEQAALRAAAGDADGAIFTWKTVRALLPEWDGPLQALQALYGQRQDHEALFEVLWSRHGLAADTDAAVALLREAASVAERALDDPHRALAVWQRVGEVRPDDPEVPSERLRLATLAEDWTEVLAAGALRLARLSGPRRLDLARRLARVADAEGADASQAERFWSEVLAAEPADPEALAARVRQARASGDALALAAALDALATETQAVDRRVTLVSERAEILAARGDRVGAHAAWLAVASWDPLAHAPRRALVQLAEIEGDMPTLLAALSEALRVLDGPEEVQRLSRRRAEVAEQLGEAVLATESWERVLAFAATHSPSETEALTALQRLHLAARQTLDLRKVVQLRAARAANDAERAQILGEAAAALEAAHPSQAATALAWRVDVWRCTPAPAEAALLAVEQAASRAGLWARWAEVLGLAAARADDPEAEEALLVRRAEVEDQRLDAPDHALKTALRIFERAPGRAEHFERVEGLARRIGEYGALSKAAALAATHAEPARRGALHLLAGRTAETHLADVEAAFAHYTAAAEAGLTDADEALAALAGRHDRWPALVAWHRARLEAADDDAERVIRWQALGRLLETRAGDPEGAFEQYLLALQTAPGDAEARAAVWRLAGALNGWALVARALLMQAQRAELTERRVELLHRLAEVQHRHLGDAQTALETLRAAFSVRPADARTRAAMRAVAAEGGREAVLGRFFEEEAGWAEAQTTRVALYREAAAAFDSAGELSEAARVLGRTLELQPGDEAIIEDLLVLRRRANDPLNLAAALSRFAREGDAARQAERLDELAALYAGPLEAPAKAEETWRRRLALVPGDTECFERLVASLTARAQWTTLAETLGQRADDAARPESAAWADTPVRLDLLRREAAVLHDRLGKPREAFARMVEVARARPADLEALRTLSAWATAADGHGLVLACAERTAEEVTGAAQSEALVMLGRLARDRFGNDKMARQAFSRALALRPEDADLARELSALLAARNLHRDRVALLQLVGPAMVTEGDERPDDPAAQARWSLAVAELQADLMFRPGEALETLRALTAAQPALAVAWTRLWQMAERTRDGGVLATAAERLAALDEAPAEVWLRAAQDLDRLGERAQARAAWRARLLALPDDALAREALHRHASRDAGWGALAEDLAAVADRTARPAEAWTELGRLHRAERDDPAAADAAFAAALRHEPNRVEALAGRVMLARDRGDTDALDGLAEDLAGRLNTDAVPDAAQAALAELAAGLLYDRALRGQREAVEPTWSALLAPTRSEASLPGAEPAPEPSAATPATGSAAAKAPDFESAAIAQAADPAPSIRSELGSAADPVVAPHADLDEPSTEASTEAMLHAAELAMLDRALTGEPLQAPYPHFDEALPPRRRRGRQRPSASAARSAALDPANAEAATEDDTALASIDRALAAFPQRPPPLPRPSATTEALDEVEIEIDEALESIDLASVDLVSVDLASVDRASEDRAPVDRAETDRDPGIAGQPGDAPEDSGPPEAGPLTGAPAESGPPLAAPTVPVDPEHPPRSKGVAASMSRASSTGPEPTADSEAQSEGPVAREAGEQGGQASASPGGGPSAKATQTGTAANGPLGWLAEAHRLAPERADVAERFADALADAGQLAEAAALYQRLPPPRGLGPEDAAGRARSALRRGRAFSAVGQGEAALRAFEWAAQHHEARALALRAQAELQAVAGRTEAAVRLYARLAEAAGTAEGRVDALRTAARLADEGLRKPARAAALYAEAAAAGADDPALLSRWFTLLLELHRGAEAEAVGLRLLAHPELSSGADRAHVWTALGQRAAAAVREGLDEGAVAVTRFGQALDAAPLHPPAAEGLLHLARSLPVDLRARALARVAAVVAAPEDATEVSASASEPPLNFAPPSPGQRDASPQGLRDRLLFGLGQVYTETGAFAEARAAFSALLERQPEHAPAHLALAATWRRLAAQAEAEREVAGDAAPQTDAASEVPSAAARAQSARAAATMHQRRAVRLRPGDREALQRLAADLVAQGEHRGAALPARLAALLGGEPLPPVQRPALTELDPEGRASGRAAEAGPAAKVLAALDTWLGVAIDAQFDRGRVAPAAVALEEAQAVELERLAEALGVDPVAAVRVAPGAAVGPTGMVAVSWTPFALGVAADLWRQPEGLRRFLVGRALQAAHGPGRWLVWADAAELEALFAGAGPETGESEPAAVADWRSWLTQAISAKRRATLARWVAEAGPDALTALRDQHQVAALQAGWRVSGDVLAILDQVAEEAGEPTPLRLDDPAVWPDLLARVPAARVIYASAFEDPSA